MRRSQINFQETKLMKFLSDRELDIFTYQKLRGFSDLHIDYLQSTLESLVKKNLLSRIEKGKYCSHTFRNEYVISNYLVDDGVVGYWSALNLHGLTEQFPNVVFVQTSKQKKHKTIFGVRYQFIKVKPEKQVGIIKEGYGNHQYHITDVEKTIIDCFDLPNYSGGFAELLRAFFEAELNEDKMIIYCKAIQNLSINKRMAYLIEILNKQGMNKFLEYVQSTLNEKYTLFDPFGEDEGKFVSRWKLRMNLSEEKILNITNKQY